MSKSENGTEQSGLEPISKIIERILKKLKPSAATEKEKPMNTKFVLISLVVLSSCTGGGAGGSAEVSKSIAPDPVVIVTPSPSPSVSPSAVPYAYSGGSGTNSDPYVIAVPEDLNRIRDNVSAIFELNQSINMTGIAFEPLPSFAGQLRGNGFEIDNLTITRTDGGTSALFLQLQATAIVTGIKFYGASISSDGFAAVITGDDAGRISLCEVKGTITSGAGGNGFSTGIGKPAYVTKTGGAVFVSNSQDVHFNGTHLVGVFN